MNETSRPEGGPSHPIVTLAQAQDMLGRIVAAREETAYDPCQTAAILADLEVEFAGLIARFEAQS
jgi:hypothetical protein